MWLASFWCWTHVILSIIAIINADSVQGPRRNISNCNTNPSYLIEFQQGLQSLLLYKRGNQDSIWVSSLLAKDSAPHLVEPLLEHGLFSMVALFPMAEIHWQMLLTWMVRALGWTALLQWACIGRQYGSQVRPSTGWTHVTLLMVRTLPLAENQFIKENLISPQRWSKTGFSSIFSSRKSQESWGSLCKTLIKKVSLY